MEHNDDPITLHKYLYANVEPSNMIDPTGNFSIRSVMTTINVVSALATTAQTSYQVFQMASGDEDVPTARELGTSVITNLIFKRGASWAIQKFRRLFSKKRGKGLNQCFVGGTKVRTKDGIKSIEDVEIGDMVASRDQYSGEFRFSEVTRLYNREADSTIKLRVEMVDGKSELIETT